VIELFVERMSRVSGCHGDHVTQTRALAMKFEVVGDLKHVASFNMIEAHAFAFMQV
jgi:hypothetical protein